MAGTTFKVDGKNIRYEEAIDWQDDFLQKKKKYDESIAFLHELDSRAASLEQLVAFHLHLDPRRVELNVSRSLQGGFNTVLAVRIHDAESKDEQRDMGQSHWPQEGHHVILRFPTPARCGEAVLEKMRCEVAMYVWMQRHCPDIRIPFLYGFGLPDGRHFAHVRSVSFLRRTWLYIRQTFAALCGRPIPSNYLLVTPPSSIKLPPSYMLLEFFGSSVGKRLDLVAHPHIRPPSLQMDPAKKRNLYSSFSRIMLSLARIPQPRIGAFRYNDDGTITLDNRPLVSTMAILESEGAPRTICPDQTFSRVGDYIESMITFHEQRFLSAPHAVVSKFDGQLQMATWVFFRSLLRHFVNTEWDTGPFLLQLSDKNYCNFLVDDDWNVTAMYDLEFIISAPVESIDTPNWLNWASLDENAAAGYSAYDAERSEFMDAFREEEPQVIGTGAPSGVQLSDVMDASWQSHRLWVFATLFSLNGATQLAEYRFEPLFGSKGFPKASSLFRIWRVDAEDVLAKKVADNDTYLAQVAALFGRDKAAEDARTTDEAVAAEVPQALNAKTETD